MGKEKKIYVGYLTAEQLNKSEEQVYLTWHQSYHYLNTEWL